MNNAELASYETGDIPYDASFEGDYKCWQQSVEWHLVGMNFTVPDGVSSVKLTIYNNVDNSIGNDFAIDDIEIRLCIPPIDITGSHQVCEEDPAEPAVQPETGAAEPASETTADGASDDPEAEK